jgi:hypothetical protein
VIDPKRLQDLWEHMTPAERAEVASILNSDGRRWTPLPGPQQMALESEADIIGYGGAAGGGKTDLLCGLTLEHHERAVIFRKEKAQLEGVVQRLTELLGGTDGYNSQKGQWRIGKRLVEFGGLNDPGDENRWQGRPHDLKAYDEATEIPEAKVRFTMGWNRTSNTKQRCRTILTFNPPTTTAGRWVIRFFAPWLDKKHANPAKPGELRWFATVAGNEDYELEDGRPFVIVDDKPCYEFDPKKHSRTEIVQPKSRTFIPSRVTDNIFYLETGYVATLQSLPEPLRSQMLNGDFLAGVEDDEWQVIPTAWVEAAMDRWRPFHEAKPGPMDVLGVDVARGGKDMTILSPRHGTWFDDLKCFAGASTPDGPAVLGHVMQARRDRAVVHIDVVGVGASPYDLLVQNRIQTVPISGAAKSWEMSKDGSLRFANLRSQLWWQMREALDPTNPNPIALPDDQRLLSDLTSPLWKPAVAGIQVESKEDIKKRLGRSPDRGDAVVYALMPAIKEEALGDTFSGSAEYDRYAEIRR